MKNTNLFIVDDEAAIRDALALLTSMAGASVSVFSNAEDFLRVINTDSTGCVILDIYLGGMSGLQVLEQAICRSIRCCAGQSSTNAG